MWCMGSASTAHSTFVVVPSAGANGCTRKLTLYFFFFCGICGLLYTTTLDFGEEPARRPPPPSPPPSPPADDAADDGPPL